MIILYVFIIITGGPWNTMDISTSFEIIPVCLYPANTPYLAHSSVFFSSSLALNLLHITLYHKFRAKRNFKKPSAQVLQ